jgi:hypothetical protein
VEATRIRPAAVSGSSTRERERDLEHEAEVERIGWDTGPTRRRTGPAAVSASERRNRFESTATPRSGGAIAGRYFGETHEPIPRTVEFRFLGTGIRDLFVGGRMIAQWIPVAATDGRAMVNGTDIRLTWTGPRTVSGALVRRRRGGRSEVLHFTADQQFRRFAA